MWESEQQIVAVLGPDESGDKSEEETEENTSIIFEESEWSQVAGEASETITSGSNLPSSSNGSGLSKRERAAEKKLADTERDKARDDALKVGKLLFQVFSLNVTQDAPQSIWMECSLKL